MARPLFLTLLLVFAPVSVKATPAIDLTATDNESNSLRVHTVRVAIAAGQNADVWTYAFEVSGRGERTLEVAGTGGRLDPARASALDEWDHASAPRFVERPALNPCFFGENYARVAPPTPEYSWPRGPMVWAPEWPRPKSESLASGAVQSEQKGYAAHLRIRPSLTRRWTAPLRVERAASAREELDLSPLGILAPPGRRIEVELFVWSGGSGLDLPEAFDLPTEVAVPEVSFELPSDTRGAVIRQTRIIEGSGAVMRDYRGPAPQGAASQALEATVDAEARSAAATLSRYSFAFGKRGHLAHRLVPAAPGAPTLAPIWYVHRVWRVPMFCAIRDAYMLSVARQQANVHRNFSVMTGRPLDAVVSLSRDRGYLLEPFGGRGAASPADLSIDSVEIDRSRW